MLRVLLSMLVSLVLPPFLVHRMSAAEYSAWVLILQLSAYVSLLDVGLQTAIGKFVAENNATGNHSANRRLVSTSFTILAIASLVGAGVVVVLSWRVPEVFHQMPAALVPSVRWGLLAVGLSTAIALPFSTFGSIFNGLQQYAFPTILAIVYRTASAAVLIAVLYMHGNLVQLALVMAAFNTANAFGQFLGWRKYARERVNFSFLRFDPRSASQLFKYGSVLSVWTLATLMVSGLDTLIIGHYDYKNTGFYAVASSVTNFLLLLVSSMFGPLLPAISSMQAGTTPSRMGELCVRTTRYCSLLLCLLGMPLFFGAYPLLSLWVGRPYAAQSALYLEVLVVGNIIRQFAYPYVIAVVATGNQRLATIAAIAEASVNLGLSIFLVQKMGAIGVAIGTLVGAVVNASLHLMVSMDFTRGAILINRWRLVVQGVLRPLLSAAPSLLLYPFWRRLNMLPANPVTLAIWLIATGAVVWWVVLTREDRRELGAVLLRLLYWRVEWS
jgi:O-antigen/teichoic acid export membrane protein